jgi:hypothetical protein
MNRQIDLRGWKGEKQEQIKKITGLDQSQDGGKEWVPSLFEYSSNQWKYLVQQQNLNNGRQKMDTSEL